MKRILVLVAVMTMTALMAPAASAKPSELKISGGGVVSPDTDPAPIGFPVGGERHASFTARLDADGNANGHVNIKIVIPENGSVFSTVRGDVVNVCEMPGSDGYEIRYLVTKGGGLAFPGLYDSLYVRDDPAGDQTNQVLNLVGLTNMDCGTIDGSVGWDDVTKGDIRVVS